VSAWEPKQDVQQKILQEVQLIKFMRFQTPESNTKSWPDGASVLQQQYMHQTLEVIHDRRRQ
jgi:hypothetical protein